MSARILVVEDENEIANFLMQGLQEEGYSVVRSADGGEALDCLNQYVWDVVLLDWLLPILDGVEVLKRFREKDDRTPVLLLTARDSVSDRIRGLDEGADDYLCKPFEFGELLARIRALSRRHDRDAPMSLSYGDVRIDLMSHRCERAAAIVSLTTKEQSLLAYLMRHPNQILSRVQIYERVWEEPYYADSNTLEVHVVELRRKLEKWGSRLIHTVRNQGYVFGDPPRRSSK